MKMNKVRVVLLSLALVSLLVVPTFSWAADDGATVFKAKCAGCHGPNGEGKPAMKAPALKGTSLSSDQISDMVTKGASGKKAPHTKGVSGLTDDQAKAVAEYVKSLK
jgi:mono/diheme cytochrome c family protein